MDTKELRKEFARVLRKSFPDLESHPDILDRLGAGNPSLENIYDIGDRSLNAAWNFIDSYLDAVGHRFEDLDGIPIGEAKDKIFGIVDSFERGKEIEDESVLRYYHEKPKRLRFRRTFPWIYRE